MNQINKEKKILREKMIGLRNNLTIEEYLNKNRYIQNQFNSLEFRSSFHSFMSYVNMGYEVKTIEIIESLLKDGKKVTVPMCITKTTDLVASQIFSLDELQPSIFGLLEPKKEFVRPTPPRDIEIVLVPGLAFDRIGNRLGYGKGYYDRFLKKLTPNVLKIGLGYNFQVIKRIPVDHFDIPLDIIITEKEIIRV